MPAGHLRTAYAFEVTPRQEGNFAGGLITTTDHLQAALDASFDRSQVLTAPAVKFVVETAPSAGRRHPIRDAALSVAFADVAQTATVEALAARLAGAMDHRSKPALFMATVHETRRPTHRRFLLWTFPRQEVFTLTLTRGQVSLEMLEAFTRESDLRKLAMVEGSSSRSSMLSARVVDFQAASGDRAAADLWIEKFLGARMELSDAEGTRLLAGALRAAHNKTRGDPAAQEEISVAIAALRLSTAPRWSLEGVASTYFGDAAAEAFFSGVRPEERTAMFGVDPETFDRLVQYRRFILDNGVIVSAPFVEIGAEGGVEVSEVDGHRRLRVGGLIEEEQVRTRA